MTFTHRLATLAAVVLIPVGIAATSYLLSDDPEEPSVPSGVELDERERDGTSSATPSPTPSEPGDTATEPNEDVVPRPSATEGAPDDGDSDSNDDTGTDPDDDRGDVEDDDAGPGGDDG